jgi:hypothetical protein
MQNLIALAIVAVAAGYLGWRGWKLLAGRKAAGCGSACGGCPVNNDALPQQKPLVTIKPLQTKSDALGKI